MFFLLARRVRKQHVVDKIFRFKSEDEHFAKEEVCKYISHLRRSLVYPSFITVCDFMSL